MKERRKGEREGERDKGRESGLEIENKEVGRERKKAKIRGRQYETLKDEIYE